MCCHTQLFATVVALYTPLPYTLSVERPALMQFGLSVEEVARRYQQARTAMCQLECNATLWPEHTERYQAAIDSARWRWRAWSALDDCCRLRRRQPSYDEEGTATSYEDAEAHLRLLIGDEAFNRGAMPCPVPLEYYREIP